jgi:hypothetical protein
LSALGLPLIGVEMKNRSPRRSKTRRGTKATARSGVRSGREQLVTIYFDNKGDLLRVKPETFKVSKRAHHEVLWQTSPPNVPFSVDFQAESPFHYMQFSHMYSYSGLVRREVPGGDGKIYKYSVTAGASSIDPGGIVSP